jgi:hypothetical protein
MRWTTLFGACPYRKTGSHFSGTFFAHALVGKPVPTLPAHALDDSFWRMSLSENRFPLFRDMR